MNIENTKAQMRKGVLEQALELAQTKSRHTPSYD